MPPHFPWLALADQTFYSLPATAFRPLPVHLDGHRQLPHAQTSCGEWLVFERRDGAITLMSPLSAAAGTIVLPGLHSLNPDHKDVQVQGPAIRKLVVCSGNLVAAAVVDKPREPYVKLALCRPGSASWSWALVDGANVFARDFVLYQGRLYAFGHDRSLDMVSITADDGEPSVSSVDRVIDSVMLTSPLQPCYLLESGGALLLITETTDTLEGIKLLAPAVAKFAVYVASFERSRWTMARGDVLEKVSGGRALFVGPWCSRSVAAGGPGQPGSVGGNSIVFFSYECRYFAAFHRRRLPFYCAVFNLKTQRWQRCLLQTSVQPLKGFQATWLFPPIIRENM
jgi:hypothetical protein